LILFYSGTGGDGRANRWANRLARFIFKMNYVEELFEPCSIAVFAK
jgi:hypothetical protein